MLAIDKNTVPIEGDCVGAEFPSSCFYGVSPTLYRGFAASSVANVGGNDLAIVDLVYYEVIVLQMFIAVFWLGVSVDENDVVDWLEVSEF